MKGKKKKLNKRQKKTTSTTKQNNKIHREKKTKKKKKQNENIDSKCRSRFMYSNRNGIIIIMYVSIFYTNEISICKKKQCIKEIWLVLIGLRNGCSRESHLFVCN